MKKPFQKLRDWIEDSLRKVCGRVSPDRRVIVIVVLFILFAVVNLWIMIEGICSIGRENSRIEQKIEIPQQEIPPIIPEGDEPPDELELEIEEFFNKNFNNQDNDTTTVQ